MTLNTRRNLNNIVYSPTLRSLLPVVREELGFSGSREHLRQVKTFKNTYITIHSNFHLLFTILKQYYECVSVSEINFVI